MLGSFLNHARIGRAVNDIFQLFSANFCQILGGHFAWQAQYLVRLEGDVAPRIVNDISYVTRIKHGSHFAWQAQHLVRLEGDTCCSPHCK